MSRVQSRDFQFETGPSASPPSNAIESITLIDNMTAISQPPADLVSRTPCPVSPNPLPLPNVPIPIQLPAYRPPLSHQLSNHTTSSADSAQSTEKASGFTRFRRGSLIPFQPVPTSLEMTLRSSGPIGGDWDQTHSAAGAGVMNSRQRWGAGADADALNKRVKLDRTKEELAMAKWRVSRRSSVASPEYSVDSNRNG